jgi:cytoskeleton protein RodZ
MSVLLKKLREDSGKGIPEISSATRIKECFLEAIENEQYDKLPLEIYARGYIRGYAKYLGSSYESALEPYERYLQMKSGPKGHKADGHTAAHSVVEIPAEEQPEQAEGIRRISADLEEQVTPAVEPAETKRGKIKRGGSKFFFIILALFMISGYAAYQYFSSDDVYKDKDKVNIKKTAPFRPEPKPALAPEEAARQEQSDKGVQNPESQIKQEGQTVVPLQANQSGPAADSSQQKAVPGAAGQGKATDMNRPKPTGNTVFTDGQTPARKKHVLTFSAVEQTRVHLLIDGKEKIEVTLDPGESRTYNAYRSVTGSVNNGGGVRIKFNGKSLPQGKMGEAQRLNLPGN